MKRIVKKPEERRQEIISAAQELFQTQEYEKTTMRDIMKKLNIAKGTIYHYFKSKEELFEAVVENMVDEDVRYREKRLAEAAGNAIEKMKVLITSNSMAGDNDIILESLHQPGNVAMHTRLLAVAIEKQAHLYAGVLQQGNEESLFDVKHPLECAEFLLSAVQFLTDTGIYPWSEEDLLRRVKAFPSLIEAQLDAPDGSFDFLIEQLLNS